MDPKTGRCAILFPHGVLFRREETNMRRRLIEADLVDCVVGLGPNLFYNSAMEACVVFCRSKKGSKKRGKVLLIDAVGEIASDRTVSFLRPVHQRRIEAAYEAFVDEEGFAKVATIEEIAGHNFSLSIPLYLKRKDDETVSADAQREPSLAEACAGWEESARIFWNDMNQVVDLLNGLVDDSSEFPEVSNG
jgi:type I restriction enzyme M protein